MANLVQLYGKDIFGGTIVAGTSPDGLSLGAQHFTLTNTEYNQLNTFYIDPLIGMYKTNSGGGLARYLLVKKGAGNAPYKLATSAYPELVGKEITIYTEIHFSIDDASPFKMAFEIFPGYTRYDPTRNRRIVFEALTLGEVYYWLEEYSTQSSDSVRLVSAKRKIDLTWLGAPYLLMIRIYQGVLGICVEMLDEYSYYTSNPSITEYFSYDGETYATNQGLIAITHYSRTVGKYPAIRSINWGVVLPTIVVLDYSVRPASLANGNEYFINEGPAAGTTRGSAEFKSWLFIKGVQFTDTGVEIEPDYIDVSASRRGMPVVFSSADSPSESTDIYIGGEDYPVKSRIKFDRNLQLYLAPGSACRARVVFKPVKNR